MNNRPIGIYDSGAGGLTVWREIIKKLPHENTIYLSDSKNAPYGSKSIKELSALNIKNTTYLSELNCKLIVVACNTATTHTIKELRAAFECPIVGIEPAVKPAAQLTKTKSIGVLATANTLSSPMYRETIQKHVKGILLTEQAGYGLVDCVERGEIDSEHCHNLLKKYLSPMLSNNIDTLVLGCTHYPFLKDVIQKIIGDNIHIIDAGNAIAKRVAYLIDHFNLASDSNNSVKHTIYTNGSLKTIQSLLQIDKRVSLEKKDF